MENDSEWKPLEVEKTNICSIKCKNRNFGKNKIWIKNNILQAKDNKNK